mgnify:CR=1 FL=1
MEVESFAVSHDAACPQFYQMHHDNQTFCILTDTGYVSQRVAKTIENADAYLMECNHDTEMLRMGPYSWPLKQRILSDEGIFPMRRVPGAFGRNRHQYEKGLFGASQSA